MAKIEDLIARVGDERLREALAAEVRELKKSKRFGLVFEEHLPESVRLPHVPIRKGCHVARKTESGNRILEVVEVKGKTARCRPQGRISYDEEPEAIPVSDLLVVKHFGEPIFPTLTPIDRIARGGPEKPWHVLINADNFHALQLLLYTHERQVDVIYIDPPYNTGARDWKYNNDYVDSGDPWRHSKWLSFIQKRLRFARALLKEDSVLVVTIDEHEVHHLACLLEQMFPEAYLQMVTIVINPGGVTQERFSRVEEHALFCFFGRAGVCAGGDDFLTSSTENASPSQQTAPQWESLLRRGTGARRADRKSMFYPVIIDPKKGAAVGVGDPLPFDEEPDPAMQLGGLPVAWPIRSDLTLGRWKVGAPTLKALMTKGYVRVGKFDSKRKTWGITYATRKIRRQIESGEIVIVGRDEETGVVNLAFASDRTRPPRTVWHRNLHNAGPHGTDFLRLVFGEGGKFSFPKALYSVRDTLKTLVRDNPSATVLDFFGGSGTTLNALALLNAVDGGARRCLLVTNNEVSEEDAKELRKDGSLPGDAKWEAQGICEAVTWPRIRNTFDGSRKDGTPLPGEYFTGTYEERPGDVRIVHVSAAEGANLTVQQRKDIVRLVDGLRASQRAL